MVIRCAFQADLVLAGNGHGASTSLPTANRQRINRAFYSESLWMSLLLVFLLLLVVASVNVARNPDPEDLGGPG